MPQKADFQRGKKKDEKNCGGELVYSPEQYSMDKRVKMVANGWVGGLSARQ